MNIENMNAIVCAFAQAYHYRNNTVRIVDDPLSIRLIGNEEYHRISKSISENISLFDQSFCGTEDEALRYIVDYQISPLILARSAFAENMLQSAVKTGTGQYIILNAGYDTFANRQPDFARKLQIFEVNPPVIALDKQMRLKKAKIASPANLHMVPADLSKDSWADILSEHHSYNRRKISFYCLTGVVYRLPIWELRNILSLLGKLLTEGSSVAFDYPDQNGYSYTGTDEDPNKKINQSDVPDRKALSSLSYFELEKLLSEYGFLIYTHLTPGQMTSRYFDKYNKSNPSHRITAFEHTNYCLAVKKG